MKNVYEIFCVIFSFCFVFFVTHTIINDFPYGEINKSQYQELKQILQTCPELKDYVSSELLMYGKMRPSIFNYLTTYYEGHKKLIKLQQE